MGKPMQLGKKTGGQWYSQHRDVKQYIRERDNYTCQLCGEPGDIVDHIIPWRVSHDSTIPNLRVLCRPCNLATRRRTDKWGKYASEEEYYAYIRREIESESANQSR